MKRLLLIGCIDLTIVLLAIISLIYFHNIKTDSLDLLQTGISHAQQHDTKTVAILTDQLKENWSRHQQVLQIFIRDNYIDEIYSGIAEMEALLQYSTLDAFCIQAKNVGTLITTLYESELPLIQNIL